jgi:hypothetical protein
VVDDIAALYQENVIYRFFNYDINGDVLFAADNRLHVKVSDDLKKLFRSQEVCGWDTGSATGHAFTLNFTQQQYCCGIRTR